MTALWADLRYALRQLRKSPAFTLTAVLTLALGIGATTAIFSVVDGVLLRPLPFRNPSRLVALSDRLQGVDLGAYSAVTAPDIVAYARDTRAFSHLGGYQSTGYELSGSVHPIDINAARLGAGVFPTLGVSPLMTAKLDLPNKDYSNETKSAAFYKTMLTNLRHLPGVESAAVAMILPLDGDFWIDMARISGDTRSFFQMPTEHWRWISPGYFQTLHLPLIEGRFLSAEDYGRKDAVISERTAKKLWPGENPLGREFQHGTEKDSFTVIGVVGNARTISLAKPDPMMIYVPYWYRSDNTGGLVVRTRQDPSQMANAIRRTVWSVDPAVAVPAVRMLGGIVANSVATQRFEMDLLLLFAVSAWLLAGLGVYGVVTYSVVQRRQEIGVRMALGAQRANIYRQVLREGLAPVIAGASVGVASAFALARLLGSLLFHVSPFNPAIALAAAASLLLAGIVACLLPARRAASVDPMQALRSE